MLGHFFDAILGMVVMVAILVFAWRTFARSDDRRMLLIKWVATAALFLAVFFILWLHDPRLLLFVLFPAVIIGFMWTPSVADFIFTPLTSAFTGGSDEPDVKPFYFIATAKRMRGKPEEAIAEINKQLEKFPGDIAGLMLLATIQAEDLHDLPAAEATIAELLAQPEVTPQEVVTALHTLADWQLQYGRDPAAARASLEQIVAKFPDTQLSHAAEQRIARLGDITATRDFRENARFEVRERERDVGLGKTSPIAPVVFDADEVAAQYVKQLEKFPRDTDTREKLAVLYAEEFKRLDLAADQIEQLASFPSETPKHVARWLNLLATLYIQVGRDEENARKALHSIVQKFPKSSHAEIAARRLASLRLELNSSVNKPAKTLGVYDKDMGLRPKV